MKKKPTSARRILLVDSIVRLHNAFGQYPDVFIADVARLSEDDGTPRNWSEPYADERIKNDTGGFSVRAFMTDDGKVLHSIHGRSVSGSDFRKYGDVANAMKAMNKRREKITREIGRPSNRIDDMIQDIMAMGVDSVWMRPENGERPPINLAKGNWQCLTVGQFADHLRNVFISEPISRALLQAESGGLISAIA